MRKTLLTVSAMALLLGGVATEASGTSVRAAASKRATVGDDFFSPTTMKISRGSAVVWTWHGSNGHSVTEINGRFDSKVRSSGSYRHKFTRKGTYKIFCVVHPDDMRMTIVVR